LDRYILCWHFWKFTFTGDLSGATGTFSGNVTAATITGGTISGASISGTTINGGSISGTTGNV